LGDPRGSAMAIDAMGNYDGTYSLATLFVDPLVPGPDKAVRLSRAADSTVDVGTSFLFPGTANFTLEAWIAADAVDSDMQTVFRAYDFMNDGFIVASHTAELYFMRQAAGVQAKASVGPPTIFTPMYVVVTYNGSGVCIYANAGNPDCQPSSGAMATPPV